MKAKVLVKTDKMSHDEWLEWRKKGIGGSDAGAILGLSKFKNAFQIYLEKVGEVDISEENQSEYAYWGQQLEELVAKEFTKRTGKKVRRCNIILQHPEYSFMCANLDRIVVGEDAFLECKTTSAYNAREWKEEEIPGSYIIQLQHYLSITGYEKCYIACLIGGNRFIWKEIKRDQELINIIIRAEKTFWEEHVLKKIPPTLDGSSAAEQYLKEKYKVGNPDITIELKYEYKDKIQRYFELKQSLLEIEDEVKAIENQIKNELGEAEKGYVDKYITIWKTITSSRVDSKKLKAEYPEIYEKVLKESISRRFEIKEVN